MFDVLNTAFCASQDFTQSRLAFGKRFAPQIVAIECQQIKGEGNRRVIHNPTIQGIEVRHSFGIEADIAVPLMRAACSTIPG